MRTPPRVDLRGVVRVRVTEEIVWRLRGAGRDLVVDLMLYDNDGVITVGGYSVVGQVVDLDGEPVERVEAEQFDVKGKLKLRGSGRGEAKDERGD